MNSGSPTSVSAAVASLREAVDDLLGVGLVGLSRDELIDLVRDVEIQVRRLPVFDHAVIAELEVRRVGAELGRRDTAGLLRDLLRLSPAEARARVATASDLTGQQLPSGELLEPLLPAVAAAQAAGMVSPSHVRVIRQTLDQIPAGVPIEEVHRAEQTLVQHAANLDPILLATAGRHLIDVLDPDGTLTADRDHDRRRDATLTPRRDGSGELHAHLTPAALAVWRAVLDPLAAPCPADGGLADPRTPGQRLHDGLLDAGLRLLRSGSLPECGGTPITVAVTMTLDQLEARTGLATTSHGGTLSVAELLRLAAEADLIPTVLNDAGGVLAYGRTRRTASPAQRRVLTVRDGGCSFPGCHIPASWTQAHHVIPWIDGGRTDLDNLTLLCGYHHREFAALDWTVRMTDGVPEWIPPAWIDPEQQPRRNELTHPTNPSPGRVMARIARSGAGAVQTVVRQWDG